MKIKKKRITTKFTFPYMIMYAKTQSMVHKKRLVIIVNNKKGGE